MFLLIVPGCLNYTCHTVGEPGDQRLKNNAFFFCFGHRYMRNEVDPHCIEI